MADRPAVAKVVYLLLLVVAATPGRVCVCRTGAQMTDLKYPIEMVNGVPVVAAPAGSTRKPAAPPARLPCT
jgi:hypothetical protein